MAFFKRIGVARAILVVAVLLAVVIGQAKPLFAAQSELKELFFAGDAYGISAASQLEAKRAAAANLATVAERYAGVDETPVSKSQWNLAQALKTQSISRILQEDASLTHAATALYAALQEASLSEEDARRVSEQYADFLAAGDRFKRCGFYTAATAFNADFGGGVYALLGVEPYPLA